MFNTLDRRIGGVVFKVAAALEDAGHKVSMVKLLKDFEQDTQREFDLLRYRGLPRKLTHELRRKFWAQAKLMALYRWQKSLPQRSSPAPAGTREALWTRHGRPESPRQREEFLVSQGVPIGQAIEDGFNMIEPADSSCQLAAVWEDDSQGAETDS